MTDDLGRPSHISSPRGVAARRPGRGALRLLGAAAMLALSACGGDDGSNGNPGGTAPTTPSPTPTPVTGIVTVSGTRIMRDGATWVPHAVQMVAFVAPPAAQKGLFLDAYQHYSTAEFAAIKAWGADSVRLQISQPGADPQDALYDRSFVANYVAAVKAARAQGLTVFVSIQDEPQSGQSGPTASLPNDATNRVWLNLLPMLNGDNGIVYEPYNEPEPAATAANWQAWKTAMDRIVSTIRGSGATNAIVADGLAFATTLSGVVPLADPLTKVIYSVHPYFNKAADQTVAAFDERFGNASATLPVIVGEWTTTVSFYCDANTPAAALSLLQYSQNKGIGLVAVSYDIAQPTYGSIVQDFNGTPTTFANGIRCGAAGFGPGRIVQAWYRTGAVPTALQ